MSVPIYMFAASTAVPAQGSQLLYIWTNATIEAKIIIVLLMLFSIGAWTVMVFKSLQMRRAKKLNQFFDNEFRNQKNVLGIYDRRLQVEGCPMFVVYNEG